MIRAIIFDWAGVIGADGYWIWLRKNIQDIESRRGYFQEISERVDSAAISHDDFIGILSKESGKRHEIVWPEIKDDIKINRDLIQIITRLKHAYKIGLLSNFTYPWLHELLVENDLYDTFDAHVISSVHAVIKPHADAFEKILKLLGVKARESIFIDDRQMHVDAARRLGLTGIVFTSNSQLVDELQSAGIRL